MTRWSVKTPTTGKLKNRALPYTWVRGTWTERQHTIEKELLERFGIAPVS